MVICGIELVASEARLVLLEGTKSEFVLLDKAPRKLTVSDHESQTEVAAFRDTMHAFLRENNVEVAAIKKRQTRGDYAGGPVGFKLEGIVQLCESCQVKLIPPATVSAAQRNYNPPVPGELRKYQQAAFEVAFAALPKG